MTARALFHRLIHDPDFFQAVAYGFAFAMGAALLTVSLVLLAAGR
jgi:hypothetical protein